MSVALKMQLFLYLLCCPSSSMYHAQVWWLFRSKMTENFPEVLLLFQDSLCFPSSKLTLLYDHLCFASYCNDQHISYNLEVKSSQQVTMLCTVFLCQSFVASFIKMRLVGQTEWNKLESLLTYNPKHGLMLFLSPVYTGHLINEMSSVWACHDFAQKSEPMDKLVVNLGRMRK